MLLQLFWIVRWDHLPKVQRSDDGEDGGMTTTVTDLQRNLALYDYIFLFLSGYFGHINGINKENLNNDDSSGVTTETMSFRDKLKFFRKPPDQQE